MRLPAAVTRGGKCIRGLRAPWVGSATDAWLVEGAGAGVGVEGAALCAGGVPAVAVSPTEQTTVPGLTVSPTLTCEAGHSVGHRDEGQCADVHGLYLPLTGASLEPAESFKSCEGCWRVQAGVKDRCAYKCKCGAHLEGRQEPSVRTLDVYSHLHTRHIQCTRDQTGQAYCGAASGSHVVPENLSGRVGFAL